jgi:hypothetical protein
MIDPAAIPRIDGNMAELASHADSIGSSGTAVTDIGARIHQGWQGLASFYVTPDAAELFAATGPVMSVSASVGEDLGSAAEALRVFAADAAAIQARLESLRGEANALVAAYTAAQDESTTVTLDDRGAGIDAAVAAQIEAWEAAQLRCANALRELTGAPRVTEYPSAAATSIIPPGGLLGSLGEGYPIDETPPGSTVFPVIDLGPSILINVPAPPGAGTVAGPGTYPPPGGLLGGSPLGPGSYPPPGGLLGGGLPGPGAGLPPGPFPGEGLALNSAEGGPADDGIRPDATGKVHGPLPPHVPGNWTEDDLEDLAEDLRNSIATRQAEQLRLGEEGGHRARIGEEERLLRQISRILNP